MTSDILTNGIYKILDQQNVYYFTVESDYTIHHFERLLATNQDRGRWKWIAETKLIAYEKMDNPKAHKAHIDGHDLFPRYYFFEESMTKEFLQWMKIREQTIIKVNIPEI